MSIPPQRQLEIRRHTSATVPENLPRWEAYSRRGGSFPLTRHPGWLQVLERGLGHTPYCLEALEAGRLVGVLPLAAVVGLFGHFLVGLPYLNSGGVQDLVIHVLAPQRYEVANYPNVTVPTNLDVPDSARDDFAESANVSANSVMS